MVHQSAKLDFLLDDKMLSQERRDTSSLFSSPGDREVESKGGEAFELVPKPTSRSEKFSPEGVLLVHGNSVQWVQ